jgi:hypothetical protein
MVSCYAALLTTIVTSGCGHHGFARATDGGASDAQDASASDTPGDADTLTSCLPSPLPKLEYASPMFSDFATAWNADGGTWAVIAGDLEQSDAGANLAYAYHDVFISDYRVVATLLATGGNRAVELAFRIDATDRNMYHCNWEPHSGDLILQRTVLGTSTSALQLERMTVPLAMVPDPNAVTMEVQAIGSQFECCLVGIDGASISATDPNLATGAVGVKTFFRSARFRDFAVYY